jgi:hypothetical protein
MINISKQIKYYGLKKVPCKVTSKELAIGVKIEREHTNNPKIARAIAIAHLCKESPVYYSKGLIQMERRLKKLQGGNKK